MKNSMPCSYCPRKCCKACKPLKDTETSISARVPIAFVLFHAFMQPDRIGTRQSDGLIPNLDLSKFAIAFIFTIIKIGTKSIIKAIKIYLFVV